MLSAMSCFTKLLIIIGLILTAVSLCWPTILSTLMYKELKLSPGSKSFTHWEKTPVPMYIDIYFHNWTNPKDIYSEKPQFSQMGPYRFYEKRTKVNLKWNDNGTVSYRQTRHWYFDPENTNGSLTDKVTTVNMVAGTIAHKMRFESSNNQRSVSFGFTTLDYDVHMVKTVEELLFNGYSDHILTIIYFMPQYKGVSDKFGWFYKRNGSAEIDGLFNMNTGSADLRDVGKINSWNNKETTGAFSGKCGEVFGTSGEVFPPWLTRNNKIGLFSGDFCRTINLSYEEDAEENGIRGLKFSAGTNLVDSGHLDPETECYRNGEATPLGVLNLTECRMGAPLFISYPHFYLGSPELQQHVGGMNPQKDLHSFDLTIEPTLGIPLDLKARFQVNMMLQPNEHILIYQDLPNRYYMPLLWFDQRALLNEPIADEVRLMVSLYDITTNIAKWLLPIGLLAAAAGITSACRTINRAPPNKYLSYTVYTLSNTSPKSEALVPVGLQN